ncbi:helix-turn-helix transcriptional regulator [Clostridium botulinum]|nr:helix-turn-helix transcriptional regulator [Clostridium botulinum]NFS54504.1 helix-turn-helix transcriptional regulator [Clostridium botulinum]NFT18617.1 helix-turn-helix transcriptional regulator [Clostridium botulinum]
MSIGAKIKQKRQEKNISREVLSNKLNVSISTLAKYEQNQRMPKLETLKKLAEILDVSVEYLLEEQSLDNTLRKIEDMDKTIQDISKPILNQQEKEQLLMNGLDNIQKTFERVKTNQNDMMKLIEEQKNILNDNSGILALIGLCKSFGLKIKGVPNEFNENIQDYNIKYKTENFNISEEDFQRLLKNVCDFTLKEALNSKLYDFIYNPLDE